MVGGAELETTLECVVVAVRGIGSNVAVLICVGELVMGFVWVDVSSRHPLNTDVLSFVL